MSSFADLRASMSALHMDAGAASAAAAAVPAARQAAFVGASELPTPAAAQLQSDLAKQLSAQMDYNNELLTQLQKLEEQQLAFQRAAADKQASLRQALGALEASRLEGQDVKRKLAAAQEANLRLTDDLKDTKVENGTLKRQLEGLERLCLEARDEISGFREERGALAGQVDALTRDNKQLRKQLADVTEELGERANALQAANAALTKELGELRAKQGPLMAEVEAARSNLLKLHEDAEDAKRARSDMLQKLDRAQVALAAHEGVIRELKASETRLLRMLEDEQGRVGALQAGAARYEDLVAKKDAEALMAAQQAANLANDVRRYQDENAAVRKELETVSAELLAQARARAADQDHFDARIREAVDDMRRIGEEARLREAAHAAELARRSEEAVAQRREAEARYNALQGDLAAMHDLSTGLRNEKAAQARAFEEERGAYERRVAELTHRLTVAQESAGRTETELRAVTTALGSEVATLKAEAASRVERHYNMLTALQGAMRALRADAETAREDYAVLAAAVKALHTRVGESLEAQQRPITTWYEEVQRAFLVLMDSAEGAKRARAATAETARALEASLDEARASRAILEDTVGRLEQELAAKAAKIEELGAVMNGREAAAQDALRSAAVAHEEIASELGRSRAAFDRAQKTNLALQSDNARLTSEMADAAAKHTARVAALDEQVTTLQSSVRGLTSQVEALGDERNKLGAQVENQAGALETLRREKAALAAALDENAETARATISTYMAQVGSLTESLKRMEAQLKQTQALLAVVQEQRRTLQEANTQLKAELDERYRAFLEATGGPGSAAAAAHGGSGLEATTASLAGLDLDSALGRSRRFDE